MVPVDAGSIPARPHKIIRRLQVSSFQRSRKNLNRSEGRELYRAIRDNDFSLTQMFLFKTKRKLENYGG